MPERSPVYHFFLFRTGKKKLKEYSGFFMRNFFLPWVPFAKLLAKYKYLIKSQGKKITNRNPVSYLYVVIENEILCFVPGFVGNGQFLAAFLPSCSNNATATSRCHAFPESVFVLPFPV